jgi:hypothetical protein
MCRFVEVTLDMLMFEEGSLEGWELGESETTGETGWEAERVQELKTQKVMPSLSASTLMYCSIGSHPHASLHGVIHMISRLRDRMVDPGRPCLNPLDSEISHFHFDQHSSPVGFASSLHPAVHTKSR